MKENIEQKTEEAYLSGANAEYYRYFELRKFEKEQNKLDFLSMRPLNEGKLKEFMDLIKKREGELGKDLGTFVQEYLRGVDEFCLRGIAGKFSFEVMDENKKIMGAFSLFHPLVVPPLIYAPARKVYDENRPSFGWPYSTSDYLVRKKYSSLVKEADKKCDKTEEKARNLLRLLEGEELIVRFKVIKLETSPWYKIPIIERPWRRNIKVIHKRRKI